MSTPTSAPLKISMDIFIYKKKLLAYILESKTQKVAFVFGFLTFLIFESAVFFNLKFI